MSRHEPCRCQKCGREIKFQFGVEVCNTCAAAARRAAGGLSVRERRQTAERALARERSDASASRGRWYKQVV
jgi:hypothetical protein